MGIRKLIRWSCLLVNSRNTRLSEQPSTREVGTQKLRSIRLYWYCRLSPYVLSDLIGNRDSEIIKIAERER